MGKIFTDSAAALDGILFDGMTVLAMTLGGKAASSLIARMAQAGVGNLTIVTDEPNTGVFDQLFARGLIRRMITSAPPGDTLFTNVYRTRPVELEFENADVLQERLAAGRVCQAPYFLTRTGLGLPTNEGKVLERCGVEALIREAPIRAVLALISGAQADTEGGVTLHQRGSAQSLAAVAAMVTVVEADTVLAAGKLNPDLVDIRGLHVDRIIRPDVRAAQPRRDRVFALEAV